MRCSPVPLLSVFIAFTAVSTIAWSNTAGFQYISPLPGSSLVSRETNIIIRPGGLMAQNSINSPSPLAVNGSLSGRHEGKMILSDDLRTLVFNPSTPFLSGETVTVLLEVGIRHADGTPVSPLSFFFTITTTSRAVASDVSYPSGSLMSINALRLTGSSFSVLDSLPMDFPPINLVESDHPTTGGIFLDNIVFDTTIHTTNYLMVLDNTGRPLTYHRIGNPCLDFMQQPNGMFTYFNTHFGSFVETDTSYTQSRVYSAGNGSLTDPHELRLLPNGHALLIALDRQIVRMDTIVPGGNPNAIVIGNTIQELDQSGNVVFQWRSWDHFRIIDATHEDLTAPAIDYVHMNALDIDTDGNLLLSSRHQSEITKIDRQTGEIIWRLGGVNNQFTFVNDSLGFSYQHAIRRIANGLSRFLTMATFTPPRSHGQQSIRSMRQGGSQLLCGNTVTLRTSLVLPWDTSRDSMTETR